MLKKSVLLLMLIFAAGFASPSSADQNEKIFGVMDDNPVMSLAAQAGFDVVKKTVWLSPTQWHWDDLDARYRDQLTQDMTQAQQNGIRVILELFPVPKYGPPRGPSQMRHTCDVAKDLLDRFPETYGIEIGVEPNSYTFWRPQFYPNGRQASAAAYEKWLAFCYDRIKDSHPDVLVIGGSLSSRGEDDRHKQKSGTSPVLFLQKFCDALVATGRTTPVMDVLDMHTYPDPEDQDPEVQHPFPSTTITIADGAKLDGVLSCFKRAGLPVPPHIWGEGGYNTSIPPWAEKRFGYRGEKPDSIRLIDETTQGRYIAEEINIAYCQPDSLGFINFHIVDDPNLSEDWQSGIAYHPAPQKRSKSSVSTNYTLKQSWPIVRKALDAARSGTINCG